MRSTLKLPASFFIELCVLRDVKEDAGSRDSARAARVFSSSSSYRRWNKLYSARGKFRAARGLRALCVYGARRRRSLSLERRRNAYFYGIYRGRKSFMRAGCSWIIVCRVIYFPGRFFRIRSRVQQFCPELCGIRSLLWFCRVSMKMRFNGFVTTINIWFFLLWNFHSNYNSCDD